MTALLALLCFFLSLHIYIDCFVIQCKYNPYYLTITNNFTFNLKKMIYFGKNLAFLRGKEKLTLDKMSEMVGFGRSQWNNYEKETSFPKFLDLIQISEYFKISETDLIHKNLEIEGISIQEKHKVSFDINLELLMMQKEKIARLEIELQEAREANKDKS
ncbi:helix-turn-helix domain-containing protein [Flavobacterium psychrophilum]